MANPKILFSWRNDEPKLQSCENVTSEVKKRVVIHTGESIDVTFKQPDSWSGSEWQLQGIEFTKVIGYVGQEPYHLELQASKDFFFSETEFDPNHCPDLIGKSSATLAAEDGKVTVRAKDLSTIKDKDEVVLKYRLWVSNKPHLQSTVTSTLRSTSLFLAINELSPAFRKNAGGTL